MSRIDGRMATGGTKKLGIWTRVEERYIITRRVWVETLIKCIAVGVRPMAWPSRCVCCLARAEQLAKKALVETRSQ